MPDRRGRWLRLTRSAVEWSHECDEAADHLARDQDAVSQLRQ
jgi:hypothetical protein